MNIEQLLLADVKELRRLQAEVERGLSALGDRHELARCRARWKVLDVEIDALLGDIRVHRIRDNSTCT